MNHYNKQIHTHTPPICQCSDLASAVSGPSVWVSISCLQQQRNIDEPEEEEEEEELELTKNTIALLNVMWQKRQAAGDSRQWERLACRMNISRDVPWGLNHTTGSKGFQTSHCGEELMTDIIRVVNHRENKWDCKLKDSRKTSHR